MRRVTDLVSKPVIWERKTTLFIASTISSRTPGTGSNRVPVPTLAPALLDPHILSLLTQRWAQSETYWIDGELGKTHYNDTKLTSSPSFVRHSDPTTPWWNRRSPQVVVGSRDRPYVIFVGANDRDRGHGGASCHLSKVLPIVLNFKPMLHCRRVWRKV